MVTNSIRRRFFLLGLVIFVLAGAAWALLVVYFPTPPSHVPVAVGFKGGTYELFFAEYKNLLARHGVTLEYRSTGGAVENQKLLDDPNSGIQVGFVQGGIESSKDAPDLVSLGRIAYQPFYIFCRADETADDITQLKGKRIAIGAPGNGSAVAAKTILAAAGITAKNSTFLPQFSKAAVDALIDGKADAMFEAFSNEAVVKAAMLDKRLKILNVRGAEALTHLFPFLSKLVLPQGVVDYAQNIPPADVTLISTTVGVLARKDLHPAIVTLLAEAMTQTHGHAGLFERAAEFPTHTDPEFPMAPAASDYYRNGPSFLNRYIPFWITNSAQRLFAVLIAIFGVILPVVTYAPRVRDWWVNRRFDSWYGELHNLETSLGPQLERPRLVEIRSALAAIENDVRVAKLPASLTAKIFSLRGHIDLVRRQVAELDRSKRNGDSRAGSSSDTVRN